MKSNVDYARGLLEKAENDFTTATGGLQHDLPLDAVCFHLQQTAEKLLKALLVINNVDFPLTHELDTLLGLASALQPQLADFDDALKQFTGYAVQMRYDSSIYPDREEALEALQTVERLRTSVYSLLPPQALPGPPQGGVL